MDVWRNDGKYEETLDQTNDLRLDMAFFTPVILLIRLAKTLSSGRSFIVEDVIPVVWTKRLHIFIVSVLITTSLLPAVYNVSFCQLFRMNILLVVWPKSEVCTLWSKNVMIKYIITEIKGMGIMLRDMISNTTVAKMLFRYWKTTKYRTHKKNIYKDHIITGRFIQREVISMVWMVIYMLRNIDTLHGGFRKQG